MRVFEPVDLKFSTREEFPGLPESAFRRHSSDANTYSVLTGTPHLHRLANLDTGQREAHWDVQSMIVHADSGDVVLVSSRCNAEEDDRAADVANAFSLLVSQELLHAIQHVMREGADDAAG